MNKEESIFDQELSKLKNTNMFQLSFSESICGEKNYVIHLQIILLIFLNST